MAVLLGLGAWLAACNGDGGGPGPAQAVDCAALSDSLFPDSSRTGLATFKVVKPNRGIFRVGSEMAVLVAGVDYTSALVDLVVFGPEGGACRIPGFPKTEGIKPRERCEFRFAIPESLTTVLGKRISLVSDSVKVRVADYTDAISLDYSDSFLSITP